MKVGMVSTWQAACGIATYTDLIGTALRDLGVEVQVFGEKTMEKEPTKLPGVFCWDRRNRDSYLELKKAVLDWNPDIVHWQNEWNLHVTDGPLWELALPRPHIQTWHNIIFDQKSMWYGSMMDAHIVHNLAMAQNLPRLNGNFASRMAIVPHGTRQNKTYDSAYAKEKMGIPAEKKVIATFGFVQPRKGYHLVLGNFDLLKKYCPDAFYFAIGGEHPKGAQWTQGYTTMFRRAKELFPDDFAMTEYISDDEKIDLALSAADVVIFPHVGGQEILSASGSAHRVVDHGKLMVVSDIPFYSEFTNDMAVRIPTDVSYTVFPRWLGRLLASHDSPENQARKQKFKEYAQSTYWPKVAETHIELYKKVLGKQ